MRYTSASPSVLPDEDFYNLLPKLLEAQLQGRLLIFCGAGVSKNAGLPLFSELVEEMAEEIFLIKKEIENEGCNLEKVRYLRNDRVLEEFTQLMQDKKYDSAITALEQLSSKKIDNLKENINNYLGRCLFKNDEENLNLSGHNTILKLATTARAVRLVTTNFDNLFELAAKHLNTDIEYYHAPLIPPNANPRNWSGIIKLHGSVKEKGGSNIVLSLGDFGRAYLTEGWARRFVLDMFREFKVVFIGYSVNDPILRYIVDAINTVKQSTEDDNNIKDAYIFLPKGAKAIPGISPIYYEKSGSHEDLYEKLEEWLGFLVDSAELCQSINKLKESHPSSQNDKSLKRLKIYFAKYPETIKYFCMNPISDIKWLPYIEEEFITPYLTTSGNKEKNQEAINYFSGWLTNHLGTYQVIDWLIKNHRNITPNLLRIITLKRAQKDYHNKYDKYVSIIINDELMSFTFPDKDIYDLEYLINKIENCSSFSIELKLEILTWLKPRISVYPNQGFNKIIRDELQKELFSPLEETEITEGVLLNCINKIFRLSFLGSNYDIKRFFQAFNQEQLKTDTARFAQELINLLKYTFDLLKLLNEDKSTYDYIKFIGATYPKDGYSTKNFDLHFLVCLVRNSLESLLKIDHNKGCQLLQIMLNDGTTGYPTLSRIALYLMDKHVELNVNKKVELILPTIHHWLFEIECKQEASDFIKNNWLQFPQKQKKKLWDEIRSKIRNSDNDSGKTSAVIPFKICQRIAWIKNIAEDVLIPKKMLQFLSKEKYDLEKDSYLYSDYYEFKVLHDGSYDEQIEYTDFINYSIEKHIGLLNALADDDRFHQKNNSYALWNKWGKNDSTKALQQLKEINKIKFFPEVWKNLIQGLTSIDNGTVEYAPILKELSCMNNSNIGSITNAVCWLLRQCSGKLQLNNKDSFLAVFEKILPYAAKVKTKYNDNTAQMAAKINAGNSNNIQPEQDWYSDAINHGIGYLTQALIGCMIKSSDGKYGDISLSFTQYFNKLLEAVKEKECNIYVKVILTSKLYALYILIPEWTREHVIPLLSWKDNRDNCDTEQFWNSYLSYDLYMSKELFQDIKVDFLKCLRQIKLSYTTARRNLIHLLMELYLDNEILLEDIIVNLHNTEDRKAPLLWLHHKLETSENKEAVQKYYNLLKQISNKLVKTIFPLEEDINYWIIKCLFSIQYTLYQNDWNEDKIWSKDIGCISNDWLIYDIITKILDMEEGFAAYNLWRKPQFLLKILGKILPYEKNKFPTTGYYPIPNLDKVLSKFKQVMSEDELEKNEYYIKLRNIVTRTN